jgi:oligopeptide transport system ATP-binding protein
VYRLHGGLGEGVVQFDAHEHAPAANVLDGKLAGQTPERVHQTVPEDSGTLDQAFLLDDIEHPCSDCHPNAASGDANDLLPVLTAENVVVEYRGRPPLRAVDGVSVVIAPGEVVALVGESGCGKSSFARAVIGIQKRASGRIQLGNNDVSKLGLRRRSAEMTAMQMVFQDPDSSLSPRRRIGEQIGDGVRAALARGEAGSDPSEWLSRVGLDPLAVNRYPHEFSGGRSRELRSPARWRHGLGCSSPTSQSPRSTPQPRPVSPRSMRALSRESGAGMLFISHDLSVVRRIADRTLVMYRGQIVESGHTETLWNNPVHPYTQALLAAIPVPDGAGQLPVAPQDSDRKAWDDIPAI